MYLTYYFLAYNYTGNANVRDPEPLRSLRTRQGTAASLQWTGQRNGSRHGSPNAGTFGVRHEATFIQARPLGEVSTMEGRLQ